MRRRATIAALIAATLQLAGSPAIAESIATGPEVGERIPDFEVADQNGKRRTFDDLRGPEGLLLLFHRSADW